jgi:hypothetical protein
MSGAPLMLWSCLAVGLAVTVGGEVVRSRATVDRAAPVSRVAIASKAEPAALATGAQVPRWAATALARPLFDPSRRPPGATAATTAAREAPAVPRLTGVLVSPAGKSAIFTVVGDPHPVVATEGGRVSGFVVRSIGAGEATLVGADGIRVLRPSFDPHPQSPRPDTSPQPAAQTGIPGLPGPFGVLHPPPGGIAVPGLARPAPPGQPQSAR